jgi:cytidine deaminase
MSDDEGGLIEAATLARDRSYVPYSSFRMGAAVRCADGTIVPGALVENVSLGLAMCAERSALFATVALGLVPTTLAIVSERTSGRLTFPCGACLQVALELAGPELTVIACEPGGESSRARLGDLIPRAPRRGTYASG